MRILVFQHVAVEHPGVFRDFWAVDGHEYVPVQLDAGDPIPPLQEFDLMVSMGGPMDVWQDDTCPWLAAEKDAIRRWVVDEARPFLGICLGHQLLADALGGSVGLMQSPEVGIMPVTLTEAGSREPLFDGLPHRMSTFQWHASEVKTLPENAVLLASNAACPVQAFRYGRFAFGLQYHCELTPATVSEWQAIPQYSASLKQALGEDAQSLAAKVASSLPGFRSSAQRLNANLMRLMD